MTSTTPPTTNNVPNKERRLIARFDILGFDIDILNNDAESLLIAFMTGGSHRWLTMTGQIKLLFSYFS